MTNYYGKLVQSRGPTPNPVLLLGEAPGKTEAFSTGAAFTGASGQSLDAYCSHVGISEPFITNMSDRRCFDPEDPDEDIDPDDSVIRANEPRLIREIMMCRPKVIGALGRIATRWLTNQDMTMEVGNGRVFPTTKPWITWDCKVIPVYHPAAGLYQPALQAQTLIGLSEVAFYGHGVIPDLPNRKRVLRLGMDTCGFVGMDTEGTPAHPVCLSYCFPGEAPVVLWYSDPYFSAKLDQLFQWIVGRGDVILLHNLLWDWQVIYAMGVDLGSLGVEVWDTMVNLWHRTEPSMSLKAAGPRWLGMPMREYKDVVGPHLISAWMSWWSEAVEAAQIQTRMEQVFTAKTKKPKLKGGQPVFKLVGPETEVALVELYQSKVEPKLGNLSLADMEKFRLKLEGPGGLGVNSSPTPPRMETALTLLPREEAEAYAGDDALATVSLYPLIAPVNPPRYMRLDQGVMPILAEMQQRGMPVDRDRVTSLHAEITRTLEEREAAVRALLPEAKRDININSTQQLYIALFDRKDKGGLGLVHTGKTTRTGMPKMDETVLSQVKDQHPIIDAILSYNEAETLESTFAGPLVERALRSTDGRIHPKFKSWVVPSGRLSTEDPNFLAFPARTELGGRIRKCFPAPPPNMMGSTDLSQIELRGMAALSGDPVMLDAFKHGKDLHQITADAVGISRRDAKTVNFAVIYLCSAAGLYDQMKAAGAKILEGKTQAEGISICDDIIKGWNRKYEGVPDYVNRVKGYILNHGYIQGVSGRVWYLPAALFNTRRQEFMREAAFRQGVNFTIQEAAQAAEKWAMIEARDLLVEAEMWKQTIWPLLQIHDEWLLEGHQDYIEAACCIVQGVKRTACDWMWGMDLGYTKVSEVPIDAEYKVGASWGECK